MRERGREDFQASLLLLRWGRKSELARAVGSERRTCLMVMDSLFGLIIPCEGSMKSSLKV